MLGTSEENKDQPPVSHIFLVSQSIMIITITKSKKWLEFS